MKLRVWEPETAPRAIVQIVHGMAEHIGRYDRLARALNSRGFLAAGHDHRGHGPDAALKGYFADENGWDAVVGDIREATLELKRRYPGLPVFLLGHSMGSFAVREYLLRWGDELSGAVLSGTGWYPLPLCLAGQAVAALSPKKKPARLVDKLAFSGNNRPFSPARTPYDWLTSDEAMLDSYMADPDCGFVFTGGAYRDFFSGLRRLTDLSRLSRMPKDLPVLFLSGTMDPVGQMGRGVETVARQFRSAGMRSVTVRLFPDARHEVFNETIRAEADAFLASWLEEQPSMRKK